MVPNEERILFGKAGVQYISRSHKKKNNGYNDFYFFKRKDNGRTSQEMRSRTLNGGEVISEIEA